MDIFVEFTIKTIRAGNVTAILFTDTSTHFLHIHAPIIYKDLQGNQIEIIGNTCDIQGGFCMVKIPIKNLNLFLIMSLNLPRVSKVELV
jgi:hypothetical protein